MRIEPKAPVRLLALAALLAQACWTDDCGADCDPKVSDCSLSTTCCTPTGVATATPTPLSPMSLVCQRQASAGDERVELDLVMRGGLPPYAWRVDFGDGTPPEQGTHPGPTSFDQEARRSVRHSYPVQPGLEPLTYTARGAMTDARGSTEACTITYSVDPQRIDLDCVRTPEEGTAPLTVGFEARPTGCAGPCRVTWWFQDTDETVEGRRVLHTFHEPGPSALGTWATRGILDDGPGRVFECGRGIIVHPPAGPGGPTVATPTATPQATATPIATATPLPTATPISNAPPVISGFAVFPNEILIGGPAAAVSATITDPEGQPITWTLTIAPGSAATGTFAPASGAGGAVSAQFTAGATPGIASLRLTATDGLGATTQATVSAFLFLPN